MKNQKFSFVIAIAVVLILGAVMLLLYLPTPPALPYPSPVAQTNPATQTAAPASSSAPVFMDDGSRITLKSMTREEATWIYAHRVQKDVYYDWEQPINFYGKVVDQQNEPVTDASAKMIWTTLGVPGGTSERTVSSDENGLFSLTHQTGKGLEVRVEKDGYYTADGGAGGVNFEFANPSSTDYYEPDHSKPVIFHLRKRGMNAARLIHWKRRVALDAQNKRALDLQSGYDTNGTSHSIVVQVLENTRTFGAYSWSSTVSIIGGGLRLTTEQYPFFAPTNGYQSSVGVNMATPKPPFWDGSNGGLFYVQTPQGYGRYKVSMDVGTNWIEVEGYLNPVSGDRNLEPASN